MKILMVTMSMQIGGAETHILELCRELKRMGHSVTLASNGGVYADELESEGIPQVKLPLHRKSPRDVVKSYIGLKKLIRHGEFDIVHAHARIPAFICGLLWERIRLKDGRKFRFVTTAHLNFSVNKLWRKISRWGERSMAVSEDIADYLVKEYNFPRERVHLTINGVDLNKFSPETDYSELLKNHSLDKNRRRIVYMSRLDADRADPAYRILNIAERLHTDFPDIDILIVGGGTELNAIQKRVNDINQKSDKAFVFTTGAVSNTNEYCAAADIFVGVSRSLLEAMATAKPVIIAGNQGSLGIFDESKIAPAVETNFCCRGFPQATEDDLYSEICKLLTENPQKLAKMGEYNRNFVLERYTSSRMAQDYIEMYEKLLESPVPYFGKSDVIVSGYYGFGNLGDESLLDIIAQLLAKERKNIKIAALTRYPKDDKMRTGLRCVSRVSPISILYNISHSKLLISGGGSLLQDATSKRSLKYYAGIIRCAEFFGKKTAVFASGIGPISYESNRKLTKLLLNKVDRISVRDPESKSELERIGVEREIIVGADPAFLIKPADEARLSKIRRNLKIDEDYFVVSLRIMPQSKKSTVEVRQRNAQLNEAIFNASVKFCGEIAKKYNLIPVILPMQESMDRQLCESVVEAVENAVLYSPSSAPELIGILKKAKFVVGMRLHAIIFASSAGVPVIGLSYDPKVTAIMSALDQPYKISLTEDSGEMAENVKIAADSVMVNREEIVKKLAKKAEEMRESCLRDVRNVVKLLDR